MTSKDYLLSEKSDLRIVLIGKVEVGKTAVMNSILRCSWKNKETASQTQIGVFSYTETCQKEEVHIDEQKVVIVDTPGLCDSEKEDKVVMREIKEKFSLADPGPHVFLFVLKPEPFTQGCQNIVETIWKTFGEDAPKFSVALFTHGDELKEKGKTIKEFIDESTELNSFVSKCQGGFYAIDNNNQDPSEVTELLQFINKVVDNNEGRCYTKEMLETAMRNSGMRKKISLSVRGSAFAGAGVGGIATYFAGSTIGVPIGAVAGGAVGGVMGAVGIVTAEYIKEKCFTQ